MKKGLFFYLQITACCLLLAACEKTPEVFSVNNFTMTDTIGRAAAGVQPLTVPDIDGIWTGMEHTIRIEGSNSVVNGLPTYSIGFIDTVHSRDSGSTWYEVDFVKTGGQPYAEVISPGFKHDEHDFNLVLSTYARINKLTNDTIIVQLLNSGFTEGWLKVKGYKYFVTTEDKRHKEHPVCLTEDLPQLATLLKELYRVPKAFQMADTIVRKQL